MFFYFLENDTNDLYELLGEGKCHQADGKSSLRYTAKFHRLRPHNASNNADQAKERCRKLCARYSWCYAAEVVLVDYWPTPECDLITDRPSFENANGQGQNYEWAKPKFIDGVYYQTYCSGCQDDENKASNWGGGRLKPSPDYYCYKKKGIRQMSELIL